MTTTLYYEHIEADGGPDPTILTGVLSIEGLPRNLRMSVENLMVDCIESAPELCSPGVDPASCDWFTRWSQDVSWSLPGDYRIRCRQALTGTAEEFELLESSLHALTNAEGYRVNLRIVEP